MLMTINVRKETEKTTNNNKKSYLNHLKKVVQELGSSIGLPVSELSIPQSSEKDQQINKENLYYTNNANEGSITNNKE